MRYGFARSPWIAAALLPAVLGLAQPAGAQVTEYADTWASDQLDSNNNLTLYGYGSATADGDGWLRLQVRIWNPNAQSVAFGGASGYYFVERTITTLVAWESPEGNYETVATVDYNFEHYACASKSLLFGAGRFAYRLDFVINANVARYVRCNQGTQCVAMDVWKAKIQPPQQTWPLYLYMKLIWVGGQNICFGFDIQQAALCVADT